MATHCQVCRVILKGSVTFILVPRYGYVSVEICLAKAPGTKKHLFLILQFCFFLFCDMLTLVLNYIEWEWSGWPWLVLHFFNLVTLQWIIHFQWIYIMCNPLGVGVCGTIYLRKSWFTGLWYLNVICRCNICRPCGLGGQAMAHGGSWPNVECKSAFIMQTARCSVVTCSCNNVQWSLCIMDNLGTTWSSWDNRLCPD